MGLLVVLLLVRRRYPYPSRCAQPPVSIFRRCVCVCVCVCVFVLLVIPCAFFECFTRSLGVSSFRPCSQCGACCPLGWQPPRSLLAIVWLAACARDAPPSASGGQVLACLPRKSHGGRGSRLRTLLRSKMEQMGSAMFPVLHDMETEDTQNMQGTEVLKGKHNNTTPPAAPFYRIQDETTDPPRLENEARHLVSSQLRGASVLILEGKIATPPVATHHQHRAAHLRPNTPPL